MRTSGFLLLGPQQIVPYGCTDAVPGRRFSGGEIQAEWSKGSDPSQRRVLGFEKEVQHIREAIASMPEAPARPTAGTQLDAGLA